MTHSGSINSPQWSAPERLAGDDYSFPADVFSFGVILWELCTLSEFPFPLEPLLVVISIWQCACRPKRCQMSGGA